MIDIVDRAGWVARVALRSLAIRPVRSALLACGFGLGIAVMAELLGIGEVILDQSRSPALQGGGDLVISGMFGAIESARFILSSVLERPEARRRIAARSPSKKATLFLIKPGMVLPVVARGGVPSLEKAVGDAEVARQTAWVDAAADARWSNPDPADVLHAMDRFHPPPDVPEFASSWAEWLYFNGRTADGSVRIYLTFLVSPSRESGSSHAGVRLQLVRAARSRTGSTYSTYSMRSVVNEKTLLENAPNVEIGENRIRLDGLRYVISLRLRGEDTSKSILTGELTLDAAPGRSLPPAVIHGARGWLSGYVVPVLSGRIHGTLRIADEAGAEGAGEAVPLEGAIGYHDHNWGFWQDVRWQWGQVVHDQLSFVYGRVFPPGTVADPERVPGFLGVLGPDGPLGVSTDVSISEHGSENAPQEIVVVARGNGLDVNLRFTVDQSIRTGLGMTGSAGSSSPSMDFLQLAGDYHVTGRAGGGPVDFTARGAAETFRPRVSTRESYSVDRPLRPPPNRGR